MQQKAFIRKIVYLVLLMGLLVSLYTLGRPAKVAIQAGGEPVLHPGGALSQLRDKEGLTESKIGEIDPAGSAVKLATFGMRGVAIALLWHRSQEYQKRLDWNNVIATSNQLVFLEPHFTTIWEFLGWNLSYNASAEFDDYRERYRWVIRGIDFLIRGVEFNRRAPKLCKATGWTISQKIGIADENQQYRRLLREDDEFWQRHDKLRLPSERDNWILGIRWYKQGEELVRQGVSIGNESDFLFFSNSRLNLFNYAVWKRKDGIFGEEAIRAWDNAGEEWKTFSKMLLSTAIPEDGSMRMKPGVKPKMAKLETTDLVNERKEALLLEMDGLSSGLRAKLAIERWKQLGETPGQQGTLLEVFDRIDAYKSKHDQTDYTDFRTIRDLLEKSGPDWREKLQADLLSLYTPEQLKLKEVPSMFLNEEQRDIVSKADGDVGQVRARAMEIVTVGPKVLAQEIQELDISRESGRRARDIAEEFDGFKEETRMSDLYRGILNYEFRIREVAVERTQEVDDARRKRHFARIAYYKSEIAESIRGWIDAMQSWDDLLHKPGFEDVAYEAQFIREIIDIVEKFVIILDNANTIFKGDEPLHGLIRNKLNQENNPQNSIDALDFAKRIYENGLSGRIEDPSLISVLFPNGLSDDPERRKREILEKAEEFFFTVSQRFAGLNQSVEFMKLGPLPDIRDRMIESNAYYIKTLRKLDKALPDPLPLRSFVELMIKHDSEIDQAGDAVDAGLPLLRDKKSAEAQAEFDKAIALWTPILDKYPLIPLDPTLPAHAELQRLVGFYSEALKAQNKSLPEDFPLKDFLK